MTQMRKTKPVKTKTFSENGFLNPASRNLRVVCDRFSKSFTCCVSTKLVDKKAFLFVRFQAQLSLGAIAQLT